jgi:hypothetical protein
MYSYVLRIRPFRQRLATTTVSVLVEMHRGGASGASTSGGLLNMRNPHSYALFNPIGVKSGELVHGVVWNSGEGEGSRQLTAQPTFLDCKRECMQATKVHSEGCTG